MYSADLYPNLTWKEITSLSIHTLGDITILLLDKFHVRVKNLNSLWTIKIN